MTSPTTDIDATPGPTTDPGASYASEVAALLWPRPWGRPHLTRSTRPSATTHRDLYVFPSPRRPRLLVPADLPGAAAMVQRLGNDRTTLVGPMRRALRLAVGSSAFPLARWPRLRVVAHDPRADSIERHLAGVLGTDVRVGVVLGPRRVNQKPVLQVFGTDGTLLAFAKLGHNPLTAGLVRHEARSLAEVGRLGPRLFRTPELLHAGTWSGLDVLVMSALSIEPGRSVDPATRVAAMVELAGLGGVRHHALADSPFLARLRGEATRLAGCAYGSSLPDAVASLAAIHGATELAFGGWHGDWGPWNMGMRGDLLQLWDWERHDAEVPLGLDAVHLLAQGVQPAQPVEPEREARMLAGVADALAPFGVDPSLHDLTVRLYLLEIAVRYVDALRHGARPDFERRTAWVVSLLSRLLEQPPTHPTEGRP